MCKEGEKKAAQNLLKTDLRPVTSCLQGVKGGSQLSHSMKRAILEVRETERKTRERERENKINSWCFESSQLLGVTSG